MYKLVAVDMDGTLLDENHQLSQQSKKIITQLKKRGVKIILASGRPYPSLVRFADELDLSTPLIANNGALVKKPTGEVLVHKFIAGKKVRQLLAYARENKLYTTFYFPDRLCVAKITEETRLHLEVEEVKPKEVGDLATIADQKPLAVHFRVPGGEIDEVVADLQEKFETELAVMQSAAIHIDVLPPKASKGTALAKILDKLVVQQEEVIAFGNSYNDVPMIKAAGWGVAVANSPAGVKKEADEIVLSNQQQGVAKKLEELIAAGNL